MPFTAEQMRLAQVHAQLGDWRAFAELVDSVLIDAEEFGDAVTLQQFNEQGPSGRELDYAESSVQQTVSSVIHVNVTGLEITFTVGSRPVIVEAFYPWLYGTAAATAGLAIRDGANVEKKHGAVAINTATQVNQGLVRERLTVPGEYTRRTGFARSAGTGTITNNANVATVMTTLKAYEQ